MYEFLTPKEHFIVVRNRENEFRQKRRLWNMNVIEKVLRDQKPSEDIYVSKYPDSHLVRWLILDFDSKNKRKAFKEVTRMKNFFEDNEHNTVLVDSTNKGYHLYIQIAPFLFKDEGNRVMDDWQLYFTKFVEYMIERSSKKEYQTLDQQNASAGLGGNIRLINSIHPVTQKRVEILDGSFDTMQEPTWLQDKAQRVAYQFCEIMDDIKQSRVSKTQVVDGNDPIENNDLREIFPAIFGGDIKHYTHYSMMCCPFHCEKHPSLQITKKTFKCKACGEKGNIWTLKKKGLVEFGIDGVATY